MSLLGLRRRRSRRLRWQSLVPIALCASFIGCAAENALDAGKGPASLSGCGYRYVANYNCASGDESSFAGHVGNPPGPGQVGAFEASYTTAWRDEVMISRGLGAGDPTQPAVYYPLKAIGTCAEINSPTNIRSPPQESNGHCSYYSVHSRQMAADGVALVDAHCRAFFQSEGNRQTTIQTIRDFGGSAGSIAGGAAGLLTGVAAAPAAVGFTIATTSTGLDIYSRYFLFGSDNIEDVRTLVLKALDTHRTTALPEDDNTAWTFPQAEQVILDHQEICRPAKILALVRSGIMKAPVQAVDSQGNVVNPCMPRAATSAANARSATTPGRPASRNLTVEVANPGTSGTNASCKPSSDNGDAQTAPTPAPANKSRAKTGIP